MLDDWLAEVLAVLADAALASLQREDYGVTLASAKAATRDVLSGEIAKHAMTNGTKARARYESEGGDMAEMGRWRPASRHL